MAGMSGGGLPEPEMGHTAPTPRHPVSWPVRAELTGWAVQARYPGHSPEPSAADAGRFVHSVGVEGCILG